MQQTHKHVRWERYGRNYWNAIILAIMDSVWRYVSRVTVETKWFTERILALYLIYIHSDVVLECKSMQRTCANRAWISLFKFYFIRKRLFLMYLVCISVWVYVFVSALGYFLWKHRHPTALSAALNHSVNAADVRAFEARAALTPLNLMPWTSAWKKIF
jgi:hypothetical protein